MSRQDLLKKITEIWTDKKKNSAELLELAKEIEKKQIEISEVKTKMAVESNELNVMGNDILKIENKIKELTQPDKV